MARALRGYRCPTGPLGCGSLMLHSSDGSEWREAATFASFRSLRGIAFGDERFAAVGGLGQSCIAMTEHVGNGQRTSEIGRMLQVNDLNRVAWSGERFVAVGADGTIVGKSVVISRWLDLDCRPSLELRPRPQLDVTSCFVPAWGRTQKTSDV